MGYRASATRAFAPHYKKYKEAVYLYALGAGFARVRPKGYPVLSILIRWRRKARLDWTNVVKAIEDALWTQDRDVDPGTFVVQRMTGKPEEAWVQIRYDA